LKNHRESGGFFMGVSLWAGLFAAIFLNRVPKRRDCIQKGFTLQSLTQPAAKNNLKRQQGVKIPYFFMNRRFLPIQAIANNTDESISD